MNVWIWYALVAAVLYGLHQIFTKLASTRISEGLGGFIVEAIAAATIAIYLCVLWLSRNWKQESDLTGICYSTVTGICVGLGTIAFFVLFQKGGPLSAVPIILAAGAAIMAIAGILVFNEPVSLPRVIGICLALAGLILLRS